jgi:flagellin FlaB
MKNVVEKRRKKNAGLTGIETAIILIAFVIVAAVFSFAVLNTGFQSTQKAQEVMKAGMEQAASALELDGGIVISSTVVPIS